MNSATPSIVSGRSCSGCTLCCKLLGIRELEKPRLTWCPNCTIGVGCKIYGKHPAECRSFYCSFLLTPSLGEHWKPVASKMVVSYEEDGDWIVVHVDPGRPLAWRAEPYYSEIKSWATAAAKQLGKVIVWQGANAIAILPDKEIELGPVGQDQVIVYVERRGALGPAMEAHVVDSNHPWAARFARKPPLE